MGKEAAINNHIVSFYFGSYFCPYNIWQKADNPKLAGFLNPKPIKVTVY